MSDHPITSKLFAQSPGAAQDANSRRVYVEFSGGFVGGQVRHRVSSQKKTVAAMVRRPRAGVNVLPRIVLSPCCSSCSLCADVVACIVRGYLTIVVKVDQKLKFGLPLAFDVNSTLSQDVRAATDTDLLPFLSVAVSAAIADRDSIISIRCAVAALGNQQRGNDPAKAFRVPKFVLMLRPFAAVFAFGCLHGFVCLVPLWANQISFQNTFWQGWRVVCFGHRSVPFRLVSDSIAGVNWLRASLDSQEACGQFCCVVRANIVFNPRLGRSERDGVRGEDGFNCRVVRSVDNQERPRAGAAWLASVAELVFSCFNKWRFCGHRRGFRCGVKDRATVAARCGVQRLGSDRRAFEASDCSLCQPSSLCTRGDQFAENQLAAHVRTARKWFGVRSAFKNTSFKTGLSFAGSPRIVSHRFSLCV